MGFKLGGGGILIEGVGKGCFKVALDIFFIDFGVVEGGGGWVEREILGGVDFRVG